ncbi:DUF1129 family protein [Lactococcus termiticola]|nr:DUF1129 family protein [Lactococcus termiticola]
MENLSIDLLTGKNKEYIHSVTKQLVLAGKSDEEIKTILSEALPKIIEGQGNGLLAKKILGTPTEFVASLTADKKKAKPAAGSRVGSNETPWLMWLDSSLLFLGFIMLLNGVMTMFTPRARVYGLTMAVVMAAMAGLVMYLVYRFFYSKAGSGNKWSWKGVGLVLLATAAWFGLTLGASLLPASVNPSFNPWLMALVGVLLLVLKWWLKKRYDIRSAMAPTSTVRNKQ